MFKGKRVLLILPRMFDYPSEMKKELEGMGATVTWVPERPYNLLARIVRNYSPKWYARIAEKYLTRILERTEGMQLDYVLIIGSAIINAGFLKELRNGHKNACLLTYQWDSNRLYPYFHLLEYFDKCFSFDFNDCRQTPRLSYHPLFYLERYKELRTQWNTVKKYDLLHVGSLHPERYEMLQKAAAYCRENGITFYYYVYMPFASFLKHWIRGRRFTNVRFRKLNPGDILALYSQANVILDLPQKGQTGLTMRTFEVLGAGKKLLTTNPWIEQTDFYNGNMIALCDLNKQEPFDSAFVKAISGPSEAWLERMEKHSLRNWLLHMLSDTTVATTSK